MKIIKSNSYNFINAEPFDIPFPLQFELYSGSTLLVEYFISDEGVVSYSFNPNTSEKILTSTRRALELKDIYFLFLSRVVSEQSPYVAFELEKYGVKEYNPYEILRKSHGIIPGDSYWIRFSDEDINYKKALKDYRETNEAAYKKLFEAQKAYFEKLSNPEPVDISGEVENILRQKDVNFEDLSSSINVTQAEAVYETKRDFDDAATDSADQPTMTDDDFADVMKHFEERVEHNLEKEEVAPSDSGMMSDEAIAAMLAQAGAGAEKPSPEEPPAADPNAKMSDDAIAALLAAQQAGG